VEVFLRLSPTNEDRCVTEVTDTTVKFAKDGSLADFTFDKVFPESTPQESFYRSVGLPLVDRFCRQNLSSLFRLFKSEGSSVLFAYGATGSGKSFTIQGGPSSEEGLLPRILKSIFNSLPEQCVVCPKDVKPKKAPKGEVTNGNFRTPQLFNLLLQSG
jgi:kinesin family protein 20